MADIMPSSHGGDGAGEDPPSPRGFGGGQHEADLVPPRKVRGKAKNKKLHHAFAQKGGPLSIPFDTTATYLPVGELNDMFTREVAIYMWANFAFDVMSYNKVSPAVQNAMQEHLRRRFDFEEIERDRERVQKTGGLHAVYLKRYRDRKAEAKEWFIQQGGYDDLDRVMASPPPGMSEANWRRTAEYFCTDEHKSRSESNKSNRGKQKYTNRGGTATYSSYCYKKNVHQLEAFRHAHTRSDGTFDSELAEQQYNALKAEFENMEDEECTEPQPHVVEVFENVMGSRRGHTRGIGRKPSSSTSPAFVSHQQEQTPPAFTQAQYDQMFNDPAFMERLYSVMDSRNASKKGNEDEADDEDD